MPAPDHFHANLQRGSVLLDNNRPREALPFIQEAIAANPDHPQGYAEFARCCIDLPAHRSQTIDAINRAIALEPGVSYYHGRKGWFFVCLKKYREALAAAQEGIALDPFCLTSLNALANAHTKLGQWKKAEEACLRILAQNPNESAGLNLLAQAVRRQGRGKESRAIVDRLLAQVPNNAFGHANAGYSALAAGDHLRANEHFLESLRIDPTCDFARRGLLHSLRARIWIIRLNIRLESLAQSLLPGTTNRHRYFMRVGVILGGLVLSQQVNAVYPHLGTTLFNFLLIPFVFYLYFSNISYWLTNFLLLFDPVGRHALAAREKTWAWTPVVLFALIVGVLFAVQLYTFAIALLVIVGVIALTVQIPLMLDRRREKTEARVWED